ncbi:MAG TPA: hypothetical protein VIK53_15850 [Verrucomicrobiae bacterium]
MRTFDPWVGNRYATEGIGGKRLLILGESHHGGETCNYSTFTSQVIRDEAVGEKSHKRRNFFGRAHRLIVGGRGGFSYAKREDFWSRVAFYNFIQSALDNPRDRPTNEMWQTAREPFLDTLRELAPRFMLVLDIELCRNLPPLPDGICVCPIQHPSSVGFSYDKWQPKVLSMIAANS